MTGPRKKARMRYMSLTRTCKCASANAGISPVYVAWVKFASEEEALQYAIHNQRDRRNMTDADLIKCIPAVDSRKPRGGDRKSDVAKSKGPSGPIENKSSAQQTADILGTSQNKVKKARKVIDKADPQTIEDVKSGKKSLNKAYQETQKKREEKTGKASCSECKRWPVSISKSGKPMEHGLCQKCRKEELAGQRAQEAKEKFESIPIDTEVEKEWDNILTKFNELINDKAVYGKVGRETLNRIIDFQSTIIIMVEDIKETST